MSSFLSFGDKLQNILSHRGAQLAEILSAKGSEAEARMSKAGDTVRKNAEKAAENVKAEQQARKEGDKKKTTDAAKKGQNTQGKKQPVKEPCKKCGERDEPVWKPYTKTDKKGRLKNPHGGGYVYWGSRKHALGKSGEWDKLISGGVKTESEKKVILAVAGNEGKMDSVQSYDRMVVSLGAMQKTVNTNGSGELAWQMEKFRNKYPDSYKEAFQDKGWFVAREMIPIKNRKGQVIKQKRGEPKVYYKEPGNPNSSALTGEKLKEFLNQRGTPQNVINAHKALRDAGRHPDFQRQQILDYNSRLLESLNSIPPTHNYQIGKYITSEKGTALVLDTSVNLGNNGANKAFDRTLDKFYEEYPLVNRNPEKWPASMREAYENKIVDILKSERSSVTDYIKRNSAILSPNNGLSNKVKSMKLPGNY